MCPTDVDSDDGKVTENKLMRNGHKLLTYSCGK